jgi:hypothetical protein
MSVYWDTALIPWFRRNYDLFETIAELVFQRLKAALRAKPVIGKSSPSTGMSSSRERSLALSSSSGETPSAACERFCESRSTQNGKDGSDITGAITDLSTIIFPRFSRVRFWKFESLHIIIAHRSQISQLG